MQGLRHGAWLLCLVRFIRLLLSRHQAVAIESAALRLQMAAFQRKRKRLLLSSFDRVFGIALRRLVVRSARSIAYVQPDTITRWQREGLADSGRGYRNAIRRCVVPLQCRAPGPIL